MAILLTGCEAQPLITSNSSWTIDHLEYYKDKHGICYATYNINTRGGLMTTVPCEKVGL